MDTLGVFEEIALVLFATKGAGLKIHELIY